MTFHLGTTATSIDERSVTLKNGENLQADLVVVGIGVRPAISLAERAGLAVDRGVTRGRAPRDERPAYLRSRRHCALAGPAHRRAHPRRAFCRGRAPGADRGTQHPGPPGSISMPSRSSGPSSTTSASLMSDMLRRGIAQRSTVQLEARDCTITYRRSGKKLAVATLHRDLNGLRTEVELERVITTAEEPSAIAAQTPHSKAAVG